MKPCRKRIKSSKTTGEYWYHTAVTWLTQILNNASPMQFKEKLLKDTASVTVKAAANRTSIHGARKRMLRSRSRRHMARVLEGLGLKEVADEVNRVLREEARKIFHDQKLSVAFDIHLIPYYGHPHKNKDEINRSKQKEGTTRFHALATAYVIGKKRKRFTFAVMFVPLGTTMRVVVQTLLSLLRKCGVTVSEVLLDRGFYSIEVVKLLMRLDIGFIIPMRGKRLKKKKGSYRTVYLMRSVINGKPVEQRVTAISVIKYNRGKRFKHHGAMQLCFIVYKVCLGLHQIAERYRKRFGIESSYKLNKAIRPKTSSRNPAIRLFLFSAAMLIQNLWVEVKLLFCKWLPNVSPKMITQRDFADILLYWVRRYRGERIGICDVPG